MRTTSRFAAHERVAYAECGPIPGAERSAHRLTSRTCAQLRFDPAQPTRSDIRARKCGTMIEASTGVGGL
jgi:hypothetical protein